MLPLRSLLFMAASLVMGVLLAPGVAEAATSARPAAQGSSSAGGTVVQIGFEGAFQPTGWVPMKVRVSPPGGESGQYLIRVHQRDLDGDYVIYQRTITLTGGMPNQEFWTYFKPQPVRAMGARDASAARENLRVVLCEAGGRELVQLSLGVRLDPLYSSGGNGRGNRLVLSVSEAGGAFFGYEEYRDRVVGLTENIISVGVTPAELPDLKIGYDGVDAVIWQDADPAGLEAGGGERLDALRQWVRGGGKLIVTARSEWQSLEPFSDLLPVTPTGAVELPNLVPLQTMVLQGLASGSTTNGAALGLAWREALAPTRGSAGEVQPTVRYILSEAKVDALVESTFSYEQEAELGGKISGEAPFIARRPEGFGSVSFVAVDFSNPTLRGQPSRPTPGWSLIWDKVLGLGDQPILDPRNDVKDEHEARESRDLGYALLPGSRLAGRSVALVTVALVFFIAYWLIAGPGLYFYLVAKRRTPMSWFFFGAAAVAATFVTLGVVRLILRGPPDLRHLSIARQGPVAPQVVHSEMGLYIPEDGSQRVMIDAGAIGTAPTITAFGIDPEQHEAADRRSNPITYTVNLDPPERTRDMEGAAAVVSIPYRSTLKKLEADWIGNVERGISGEPRLIATAGLCTGRLTNNTGKNLVNVHVAFRHMFRRPTGTLDEIYVVFLPRWLNGESIEGLDGLIAPANPEQPRMKLVARSSSGNQAPPSERERVYGRLSSDWAPYWHSFLRSSPLSVGASAIVDDWPEAVRRTPAMLSFFSLLPPMRRETSGGPDPTRLLRRGARELDLSAAVMAGNMVIIAEADEAPLPLRMNVNGDEVMGAGRIIYQVVLPLDRSEIAKAEEQARQAQLEEEARQRAATQVATQPASQPADAGASTRPLEP